MQKVMMRYNTENTSDLYWRLLIDGVEKLVNNVTFNCPTYTSRDKIAEKVSKFHISCNASKIEWLDEKTAVIS